MERAIAIRKLGKLLGKHMGYRVDAKAPSSEERAAAVGELIEARIKRDVLEKKRKARYEEIIAADTEYQSLRAEHEVARKRVDALQSITYRKKFTVGVSNDLFFVVKADGDTWEEVIDKLTVKNQAA